MSRNALRAQSLAAVLTAGLLTILIGSPAPAQGPIIRDVWHEIVDGEVRWGYQHVQVRKLEDGNYRYDIEVKMLVDLFASQKQEITSRGEYIVTAALRPVSFHVRSKDLAGESSLRGVAESGRLVLKSERAGVQQVVELPLEGAEPPVFSACLIDWLARLPATTDRITIRQIDEEALEMTLLQVQREPTDGPGAVWKIGSAPATEMQTITLDPSGVLLELVPDRSTRRVRRSTRERSQQLVHLKMDGRELLTFPVDKPIGSPERLRKLTVRLTWRDVAFDELKLEDARQRVVERAAKDGQHTAVLELRDPPAADESTVATIPIDDASMAPYLVETRYVKPNDPAIVAAARAALAGETNALAAVRALSRWVSAHVEGELLAGTLSGPEVLASKRGKCTEFSTLFASLARAVGIPTRLALGTRMVGGQWMGHMWNEAYVGRWVTVDASADEVDRSLVLLKLVHSDTVAGTQPVRWQLTESLTIAIDDFELAPSKLGEKYEDGVKGATFTSVDHACRIRAIGAGWSLVDSSTPGSPTIRFKREEAEGIFIHLVAFSLPTGTKPKELIEMRLKMWGSRYEVFELLESASREVAGAPGHMSRFRGRPTATSTENATTEVLWARGGHAYLLTMVSTAEEHDEGLEHFRALLATFEFLE